MKTKVFKLMAALMVVILSVVLSSCQRDQEITTKSAAETDLVQTHDYDGYSIGTITNSADHFRLAIRLDLEQLRITVPKDVLGKITDVTPLANPVTVTYSQDGKVGEQTTRTFGFTPDGQKATSTDVWGVDSAATFHYEITDVYYNGKYDSSPVDNDGNVWRIVPHFNATYTHTSDPSKSGTMELMPAYYQVAEGVNVVDSLIITTHDNEGVADGTIRNVLGFTSAQVTVTLAQPQVIVTSADKLGTVSLVTTPPVNSKDISTTTQRGMSYAKTDNFSDGQVAADIWQHLYDIAATNHVEITDVQYVDFTSTPLSAEEARITLHYHVTYSRTGDVTESGSFELYPSYRQLLSVPEPTLAWRATITKFSDDGDGKTYNRKMVKGIAEQYDTKTGEILQSFELPRTCVVKIGHPTGLDLFVKNTDIAKYNEDSWWYTGSDPAWEGVAYEQNGWKVERHTMIYEFNTQFNSDVVTNGYVAPATQLYFMAGSVTFTAPDGTAIPVTYDGEPFMVQTSVDTSDKGFITEPDYTGRTRVESDKTYQYAKSYRHAFKAYVNGAEFFAPVAISRLWTPVQ